LLVSLTPESPCYRTHLERRYGRNPDLQNAGIRSYILPVLQADFMLLETFEPSDPLFKPLPCPLAACGAAVRAPSRGATVQRLHATPALPCPVGTEAHHCGERTGRQQIQQGATGRVESAHHRRVRGAVVRGQHGRGLLGHVASVPHRRAHQVPGVLSGTNAHPGGT
jgi:hypothetical protein